MTHGSSTINIRTQAPNYDIKIITLRKGGIRGLCFFRGYFTTPQPPIKGDFYIHYLLIRILKMKILYN